MASIGFGSRESTCDLCGCDAEQRHVLENRFSTSPSVCGDCRSAYHSGNSPLLPRQPTYDRDRQLRWVGLRLGDILDLAQFVLSQLDPAPADPTPAESAARFESAPAALAELQQVRQDLELALGVESEGVPAAGERHAATRALAVALACASVARVEVLPPPQLDRLLMRVDLRYELRLLVALHVHWRASDRLGPGSDVPKLSEAARQSLERANRSYLLGRAPDSSSWRSRKDALRAALFIQLGRLDEARRVIDSALDDPQAAQVGDPRLQHLSALVQLSLGNHRAADERLLVSSNQVEASRDSEAWLDVAAANAYTRYVRAADGGRWPEARARLGDYCRLVPSDVAARFELAHTFIVGSLDAPAREVLGGVLDDSAVAMFRGCYEYLERRAEGTVLYGTCLLRIALASSADAETAASTLRQAREVVDRHLATADDSDPWAAELYSLLGQCEFGLGHVDAALAAAQQAFRLDPDRTRARDLWCLSHHGLVERLERETCRAEDFIEIVATTSVGLRAWAGDHHIRLLLAYLLHQGGTNLQFQVGADALRSPPDLRSMHHEGSTFLAYRQLLGNNLVEAWRLDSEAVSQGAAPIPFRVLSDFRSRYETWAPESREALDRTVVAALEALRAAPAD